MGRRRKPEERAIARGRIETLFGEAQRAVGLHPERARRYVALARRVGMRYQVSLPRGVKHLACRRCGEYLHPALGARRRLRSGRLVATCPACGAIARMPLAPRGGASRVAPSPQSRATARSASSEVER